MEDSIHTTRRLRCALVLLTVPLTFQILLHVFVFPEHLAAQYAWPEHAQHHQLRGAVGGTGLALCGLLLAFGPLRQGVKAAWWSLVLIGIAFYGGFWLATAIVDFGETGLTRYGTLSHNTLQTLMFAAGLFLSRPVVTEHDARAG